jgi:hypothetical protein
MCIIPTHLVDELPPKPLGSTCHPTRSISSPSSIVQNAPENAIVPSANTPKAIAAPAAVQIAQEKSFTPQVIAVPAIAQQN